MSKTNCINCGSAKDINDIKCPFCGTTYLDFTAIDFGSDQPVVCEFLMPQNFHDKNGGRFKMSMLAVPRLEEIVAETGCEIHIGVSFTPVCRPSHSDKVVTLCYDKGDNNGDS